MSTSTDVVSPDALKRYLEQMAGNDAVQERGPSTVRIRKGTKSQLGTYTTTSPQVAESPDDGFGEFIEGVETFDAIICSYVGGRKAWNGAVAGTDDSATVCSSRGGKAGRPEAAFFQPDPGFRVTPVDVAGTAVKDFVAELGDAADLADPDFEIPCDMCGMQAFKTSPAPGSGAPWCTREITLIMLVKTTVAGEESWVPALMTLSKRSLSNVEKRISGWTTRGKLPFMFTTTFTLVKGSAGSVEWADVQVDAEEHGDMVLAEAALVAHDDLYPLLTEAETAPAAATEAEESAEAEEPAKPKAKAKPKAEMPAAEEDF